MYVGTLSTITESKKESSLADKAYRVATLPIVGVGTVAGAVGGAAVGATVGAIGGAAVGGGVGLGVTSGLLYGNIDSRKPIKSKMKDMGHKMKKYFD
jgi:hypothetical protein